MLINRMRPYQIHLTPPLTTYNPHHYIGIDLQEAFVIMESTAHPYEPQSPNVLFLPNGNDPVLHYGACANLNLFPLKEASLNGPMGVFISQVARPLAFK